MNSLRRLIQQRPEECYLKFSALNGTAALIGYSVYTKPEELDPVEAAGIMFGISVMWPIIYGIAIPSAIAGTISYITH